MDAAQMHAFILEMDALDRRVSDRIRYAGGVGVQWVAASGGNTEQMAVAALVGCEVQRIVEIQNALNAGGIILGH